MYIYTHFKLNKIVLNILQFFHVLSNTCLYGTISFTDDIRVGLKTVCVYVVSFYRLKLLNINVRIEVIVYNKNEVLLRSPWCS